MPTTEVDKEKEEVAKDDGGSVVVEKQANVYVINNYVGEKANGVDGEEADVDEMFENYLEESKNRNHSRVMQKPGAIGIGVPINQSSPDAGDDDERSTRTPIPRAGTLGRGTPVRPVSHPGAFAMDAVVGMPNVHAREAPPPESEESSVQLVVPNPEGLAVAETVDEQALNGPPADLPAAAEVDLEVQHQQSEQRRQELRSETKSQVFGNFGCGMLFLVALIGAIAIPLALVNDQSSSDSSNNNNATTKPTVVDPESIVLPLLPNFTLDRMINAETPQSKAYEWLSQDPHLAEYPDFRITQRFALATFFFATGGTLDTLKENKNSSGTNPWAKVNTNWLSYDRHECDWETRSSVYDEHIAVFFHPECNPLTPIMVGRPCVGWYNHTRGGAPPPADITTTTTTRPPVQHSPHSIVDGCPYYDWGWYDHLKSNESADVINTEKEHLPEGTYQHLWLWQNNLQGSLPEELFLLTNLLSIQMEQNQLTGEVSTRIGQLSDLVVWDLTWSTLTGTLPTEIGLLSNLVVLVFSGSSLSGTLPTELGLLKDSARDFMFDGNNLEGTIPTELGLLSHLWILYLFRNQLTGTIPTEFGRFAEIDDLYFARNPLHGTVPSELGNLDRVAWLRFQETEVTGTIPTQLGQLEFLRTFNVRDTNFTGSLPISVLIDKPNLKSISLDRCGWTGSLPTELGLLTAATLLRLYSNQFTGTIPTQVGLIQTIERFYLDDNKLMTGTIPTEIGTWPVVREIGLSSNYFSGQIPSEIGQLNATNSLYCGANNLTGAIPSQMGQMESLAILDLSNNTLTGPIPIEFGQLFALDNLGLQNNDLTGVIPSQLGFLATNGSLLNLDIAGNPSLGGTLPAGICLADLLLLSFDCQPLCGCGCSCDAEDTAVVGNNTEVNNTLGVVFANNSIISTSKGGE